jgi:hypothetical protein
MAETSEPLAAPLRALCPASRSEEPAFDPLGAIAGALSVRTVEAVRVACAPAEDLAAHEKRVRKTPTKQKLTDSTQRPVRPEPR